MTPKKILMIVTTGSCCILLLSDHAPRAGLVLVLLSKRERLSTVKKKTPVLKRAMTEKREKWQTKEWYGKAKSRWEQLAGEEGGQSSHDKWKNSQPQGKWKEISVEIDAVETTVKEKTNTWNKSSKESVKRESELHKIFEQAAIDERQEHKQRGEDVRLSILGIH